MKGIDIDSLGVAYQLCFMAVDFKNLILVTYFSIMCKYCFQLHGIYETRLLKLQQQTSFSNSESELDEGMIEALEAIEQSWNFGACGPTVDPLFR